jgi:hypothetical protein
MKVPGIGEVKTPYVVGGVGVAGGIVIYAYVKRSKASAAAAAVPATDPNAVTADQIDADQIDPETGLPYSQEQSAEDDGDAFTPYGGVDPSTGVPYVDEVGQQVAAAQGTSPLTTNTMWADTAEQELENTFGYTSSTAQAAVGAYLGKRAQPDAASVSGMSTVVAEIGPPPTGGPYNVIPPASATPPPAATTKTVPKCVGLTAGSAHNEIVAAGLSPIGDPGQKATSKVKSTSPPGGAKVAAGTRVLIST